MTLGGYDNFGSSQIKSSPHLGLFHRHILALTDEWLETKGHSKKKLGLYVKKRPEGRM